MRKNRRGFTLIEVSLFLALTAALFVGIAAGVQNSIFQQRYNDAVQSFAEFLRSVYSQVSNVQNEQYGRTGKAIYGKVLTFDVAGEGDEQYNVIKSYNLIGDIISAPVEEVQLDEPCLGSSAVIDRLCTLDTSIVYRDDNVVGEGITYRTVGFVENYEPRWDSRIQTTRGWSDAPSDQYELFKGIIMITRSPSSGNISTYVLQDPYHDVLSGKSDAIKFILGQIAHCEAQGSQCIENDKYNPFNEQTEDGASVKTHYLTSAFFEPETVDFCVNPNGMDRSTIRRDIRLEAGTHNASGVEIITEERNDGDNPEEGDLNRCAI